MAPDAHLAAMKLVAGGTSLGVKRAISGSLLFIPYHQSFRFHLEKNCHYI
jgi:hypothetical protein